MSGNPLDPAPLRRRLWLLLAGFHFGGAAIALAVVLIGVAAIRFGAEAELPLAEAAGWLVILFGVFCLAALRPAPEQLPEAGTLVVDRAAEPRLFAAVEGAAARVGVRLPLEIVLTPGAAISCLEEGRLLGGGRRCRVEIGLATLHALDVPRFEAILALHLAHQADGDLLLRRVLARTFRTIDRTLERAALLERPFRRWRHRLAAAWERYERVHVHAVDEAAARASGAAVYGAALRRVSILPSLFERYLAEEVQPILDEGYVPADLYGGFRLCLEALEKTGQLERLEEEAETDDPPEQQEARFPTVGRRLERVRRLALPHPLPAPEAGVLARELVADAAGAEAQAALRWTGDPGAAARRLAWDEVAERVWAARFRSAAVAIRGALPPGAGLGFAIDWLASSSQVALAAAAWPRLLDGGLDEERLKRRARQLVNRGVAGWIGEELAAQGWRWETSPGWAVELESPDGERIAPLALLAPLGTEAGAAEAVRARLQALGLDLGERQAAPSARNHRPRSWLH